MKKILQYLFEHKTLSYEQAKEILINISKGDYNDTEVTAFITVFLMRSITIDELQGFRDGLLELCVPVDLNGYQVMDIVGTGGDGKNTFNISTLACFIVAGTGQKVAKHGNYGASSVHEENKCLHPLLPSSLPAPVLWLLLLSSLRTVLASSLHLSRSLPTISW